jgi:hypothetical protein
MLLRAAADASTLPSAPLHSPPSHKHIPNTRTRLSAPSQSFVGSALSSLVLQHIKMAALLRRHFALDAAAPDAAAAPCPEPPRSPLAAANHARRAAAAGHGPRRSSDAGAGAAQPAVAGAGAAESGASPGGPLSPGGGWGPAAGAAELSPAALEELLFGMARLEEVRVHPAAGSRGLGTGGEGVWGRRLCGGA